jgi:hypothetical protein
MKYKKVILVIMFCFSNLLVWGQDLKPKGFSAYKPYDKSFITNDLRKKNTVSFGPLIGVYGRNLDGFVPSVGLHLGYNYLIIERRKVKLSLKTKYRNEVKLGFGLHLNILSQDEQMLMLNFYRPFAAIKGKLLSWYFLSSYSLGWHKITNGPDDLKPNKFNFGLELLRLRIGKLPFHLQVGINYDLSNNFLDTERLNGGFLFGMRYDIFKK